MWTRHALQPAARRHLGSPVVELRHVGSHACRRIRTAGGAGTAMSAHASARAVDISAVRLADGRVVPLLGRWEGEGHAARFWRAAHRGGCRWFRTVLGPDYNTLHAGHFHLASGRWPVCR